MPLPPFSNPTFQMDRVFTVTAAVSGAIGVIGNISDEGDSGLFSVQIQPDNTFDGQFVVMGRSQAKAAIDGGPQAYGPAPWFPIPYQRIYGTPANASGPSALDYNFTNDPLTGNCLIVIPAAGLTVGLMVSCVTGYATVYPSIPIEGVASV